MTDKLLLKLADVQGMFIDCKFDYDKHKKEYKKIKNEIDRLEKEDYFDDNYQLHNDDEVYSLTKQLDELFFNPLNRLKEEINDLDYDINHQHKRLDDDDIEALKMLDEYMDKTNDMIKDIIKGE